MELNLGFYDLTKLGIKLINHKLLQRRLSTQEFKVVQLREGKVKGAKRRTVYDGDYWAFEGIPYARPPLGELRFRAPQPVDCWQGVRDCTQCAAKPLQQDVLLHNIEGSEDCLYLNIYVRGHAPAKPLPVMVWIYGGAFQIGEATRDLYAPDYFMRPNVGSIVLVTINYRLGALGFLSLSDPELNVPGNAGLKDQLMALRWIKHNIPSFGGDNENITVFGESAGSASVHYLLLCEQAKGLFHKAILQSGTALCPWARQTQPDLAFRLARKLGYEGANTDPQVLAFLAQQDGAKLISNPTHLWTNDEKRDFPLAPFVPIVEPYSSEGYILIEEPQKLMRAAWSKDIPIILGCCAFEGLLTYQTDKLLLKDLDDCVRLLPHEVRQQLAEDECKERGRRLRRLHFGVEDPNAETSFFLFLDAMSYKLFLHGIHRFYLSRVTGAAPTYFYRFDFDSPTFNHYRILKCGKSVRGSCHADDLSYLFYSVLSNKLPTESCEFKTIERMTAMWTAFAANSDPNCKEIAPVVWHTAKGGDATPMCLNIGEKVEFIELPDFEKMREWNRLYKTQDLF